MEKDGLLKQVTDGMVERLLEAASDGYEERCLRLPLDVYARVQIVKQNLELLEEYFLTMGGEE